MKPCIFLAIAALALPLPAAEGAAWLKIPQGARSVALGTAVSALDGGVESLWYTPASLGHQKATAVTASRQAWLAQTQDDYLALAVPLLGGGVGLYGNVLGAEDSYRDALGQEGATFGNSAWALGGAYGRKLGWLALGMGLKFVNESIASTQAQGLGVDLGTQAELGVPWLRLGASAQNIGTLSGHAGGDLELPTTYRLGLAAVETLPGLSLAVETRMLPSSREVAFLGGAEYGRAMGAWTWALRTGYDSAAAAAGGLAGFSTGAGLRYQNLKFDFTYSPYGVLGDPYRASLGWDFSAVPAPKPKSKQNAPTQRKR